MENKQEQTLSPKKNMVINILCVVVALIGLSNIFLGSIQKSSSLNNGITNNCPTEGIPSNFPMAGKGGNFACGSQ